MDWNKQEIECFIKKRTGGCKNCSIFLSYKIKTCRMFPQVLKKFAKFGYPKIEGIGY